MLFSIGGTAWERLDKAIKYAIATPIAKTQKMRDKREGEKLCQKKYDHSSGNERRLQSRRKPDPRVILECIPARLYGALCAALLSG